MRYIFEMALHQLLSALGPAALWLIIIGGGPFQICKALQSHVIGILFSILFSFVSYTVYINGYISQI